MINHISPKFDPVKVAQAYENLRKADPYAIAHRWTEYTFRPLYVPSEEIPELIPCMYGSINVSYAHTNDFSAITSKDVQAHMVEIFSRARISILVTGNFYPKVSD